MIENIPANIWTKSDLSEYQIFDVRTPLEWQEGILPNAQCLALYDNKGLLNAQFLDEFQSKKDESKKLAFVCRSGHRSMLAAELVVEKLGLKVSNLDGGMLAVKGR
ncbi:rhodanese-like domain-containing protein [Campylobacter hepaticus]|uniref:Rhodanese-like domain-containing protein n=1 Tax=Campylobacter hepaticus TaxID=1813019 RepID=A0A6A7JT54_9BACT|nr:rhodanese-like domain-containing protein [Campylobacter hepaticus]AXP08963.1 rhodanese-like domain-containing protein [Campylobacter hepaticus]MCZ0771997.1 rhodanese-like domain-containing protein [Campylobacter hepaticus]MCZ0773466.1 rhodanese-like domain-containing protein [Campylobacter hepaticus]MCZ0774716.1 rhodanese-like domain-containing protein [Campylobacter hepaticus]MDX2323766.1 rhodanese-like domain-containing protein [Campylobacter hepaticus]